MQKLTLPLLVESTMHFMKPEGSLLNTKIGNKSFESVEHFKYLGTTLTHQYGINEEIRSRLNSGNACYH
jgi:hypothetical protein